MRRLLAFCAVTVTILVALWAFGLKHLATVSAAGAPTNLELVAAAGQSGCPLGPAFTFCDQIPGPGTPPGTVSPPARFMIEALTSVSGVSASLVAVPGLSANFNSGDFAIALDSCAGSLAANQACEVDIEFHPTTTGLREAALTLMDSAGDTLALNVAGTGRSLVISPPTSAPTCTANNPQDNAFMYCNEPAGSVSASQTFTLRSANAITGLTITPTAVPGITAEFNATDFTIESMTCTMTLAANGSCSVSVAFTPASAGLRETSLIASDSQGDMTKVYLAGHTSTGLLLAPVSAACSLGSFAFCNEPVGGTTAPNVFTLSNTSGSQISGLNVPAASVAADFKVASTSCLSVLPAATSCTINVDFTPQASGLRQDMINITDNAGDIGTANFAGTGDDYELQLASGQASELTVVQGGAITFRAQATSDGVFGQNGEQVAFLCPSSSNLPAFTSCAATPCPGPVPPNSTIGFQITFVTSSPTVTAPLPLPSTPAGCNGYGAETTLGLSTPHSVEPSSNRLRRTLDRASLFPSLSLLGVLGIAWAIGLVCIRCRRATTLAGTALGPVILAFLLSIALGGALSGCHHNTAIPTGTPVGQSPMQIQAVALDSHGNLLNAARALPVVIEIDVLAAP